MTSAGGFVPMGIPAVIVHAALRRYAARSNRLRKSSSCD